MTRAKERKVVESVEKMRYEPEDFRFATPKIVADYRAKRLKCDTLCEIGSGVGFQTIAFAKSCKKVYAVEIDCRKAAYLKKNMEKLGLKNVEVIEGDGLDKKIADKVKDADVFFVDTERAESEDARKLSSVKPDVSELVSLYKDVCIEVPPQTRDISLGCEKEYVSVSGELNRLNLYFGRLKKYKTNVVILPSETRLESTGRKSLKAAKEIRHKYLYEINPAVIRAGLVNELPTAELFRYNNKEYLLSNKKIGSEFLTCYKITSICEAKDIKENLAKSGCGKVILKHSVSPSEYWSLRNKYEKDLGGSLVCYLFLFENAVICERI